MAGQGPHSLTWGDVDPALHEFDAAGVLALVRHLIPQPAKSGSSRDVAWAGAITLALVDRFGPWAGGWNWSGGGPVHAWCCPAHSLTSPTETAERVKAALLEWRAWLERLALRFAQLEAEHGSGIEAFERVAVHLVNEVVEQTAAEDDWYGHCGQVLGWYLERSGLQAELASEIVEATIDGRFESWCEPAEALTTDVVLRIAREVAQRSSEP